MKESNHWVKSKWMNLKKFEFNKQLEESYFYFFACV